MPPVRSASSTSHSRVGAAALVVGHELEHAVAGAADGVADGEQLVGRARRCPGTRPCFELCRIVRRRGERRPRRPAAPPRRGAAIASISSAVGLARGPARPSRRPAARRGAPGRPRRSTRGVRVERVEVSIFHFLPDDHAVIDGLFPFRNFLRDLTAFLLSAPSHGGVRSYYRESEEDERQVIAERGYHLITEQSRFATGRLPDDFRLASDQPKQVLPRVAPAQSAQIGQLNQLIRQYHIECYYVPFYLRNGEAAPSPETDARFRAQVEQATSCKLLGPDYYLYPNRLFADQTHLNQAGARIYTEALFQLLKDRLTPHALQ